jgi:hypothetical protein
MVVQKCYTSKGMLLHNQFNVSQRTGPNLPCFYKLSSDSSMWWSSWPSEEWNITVCPRLSKNHVVCIVNIWSWLIIAKWWTVTNSSSLGTCLQSFLRWANLQADLNMLALMYAITYETYVGQSSFAMFLIWNISCIESSTNKQSKL